MSWPTPLDGSSSGTLILNAVSKARVNRLRIILPTTAGIVSAPLAIWDVINTRVIVSMGMAWDTGPPIWPYQTPAILLYSVNFPAHFVSMPIANLLHLVSPVHYLLVFPASLLWWWFGGIMLDRGLVRNSSEWRWSLFVALLVLSSALLVAGIYSIKLAFDWWFQYGGNLWSPRALLLMEFVSPGLWGISLATLAAIAAKRVAGAK